MLSNILKNPWQAASDELALDGSEAPDAPVTPADFVQALQFVTRAGGGRQPINPEQLGDVCAQILERHLLDAFSPAQLACAAHELAVLAQTQGVRVSRDFTAALMAGLRARMRELSAQQLAAIGWAAMRLAPVPSAEQRAAYGLPDAWLAAYAAAIEAQLGAVSAGQVALPTAQQLANLLLVPTAAQASPSEAGWQALESVLLLSRRRMCSMVVAQLLTCYASLGRQPQPQVAEVLLAHLQEELLLYDHEQLTQAAFGLRALQLAAPSTLLADLTQRAALLQAAGQADAQDAELLADLLDGLARAAAAAAAAAPAPAEAR